MIAFVRHGQTAVNRDGRLQGRLDAPLSDLGVSQAHALAEYLSNAAITAVVSSPLQRAQATADAIAARHGLTTRVDERLIELDYGDWDGLPLAEVPRDGWTAWRADPSFTPPGGESLQRVTERVASFLDEVATGGIVVAVSHVSPIKAAVGLSLGIDERATWRMHLGLASITRIGARPDGERYLATFNETAHLD